MSERRPVTPDPRASLVDSGWSEPAPASERELPSYADSAREHLVTRVDDQIQARIAAMNYEDRTDVVDVPNLAPPPPPPPSAAPATKSRPQHAVPQPPSRPQHAAPQPPSRPQHAVATPPQMPLPPPQLPPPPLPVPELSAAPTDERTFVDSNPAPVSTTPPPSPPSHPPPRPSRPPPPSSRPPPQKFGSLPPPSLPPPRTPSFSPMPPPPTPTSFTPPPNLSEALFEKVGLWGSEIPLWGVLLPAFAATALAAAFIAGVFASSPREQAAAPSASAAADTTAASAPSSPAAATGADASSGSNAAASLLDRARSGDERAIGVLEHQRPEDRGTDEALALAAGKVAEELASVSKLRARLGSDPGLAKDPKVIADLRRMAQEPETSRDALGAMAALPGPISADLLYDAWTSTAEHSSTTELAQALLMGRDVRPKASPALAVALDLREAESCEDNQKILPRAIDVGDKRAFAPLTRLLRRNGCGPTKRDDCYLCLRGNGGDDQLKKALTAVKMRREPELVRRDNK
ncbi:MAG TPA: hypothetical protein VMI54_13805 [Polyangiaceae bacterium]|nr:hypothetical protein [Polyangiaceae bacterium]